MIYIITGASGFIGKKLVERLLKDKESIVIGIDINSSEINNDKYTHKIMDIREKIDIDMPDEKVMIFHLAALISVEDSMSDPNKYYNTNVLGTINVLEFMVKNNIKNIYFSSTAAVYSFGSNLLKENDECNPSSIYGMTKYHSENIIKFYTERYDINAIIFRFFNVAGGRDTQDKPHHLIPVLVNNINKKWYIYGDNYDTKDGTCVRDYIHVDDIVSAFIKIIDYNFKYEIFNLGSGAGYTVKEIINLLKEIIKKDYTIPDIIITNRRDGDPGILVADTNKFRNKTGWRPDKTLNDIIVDTLRAYIF